MLALWTGVGGLLLLQTYVATAADGRAWGFREHLGTWVAQFYRAWIWAALTPLVCWLRRYINQHHRSRVVVWSLHLLAAVAIFAFGNVIRIWLVEATLGYWKAQYFTLSWALGQLGAFSLIDFYIYWVALAGSYVSDLHWEKRQTELREQQLQTQLAQAELAALKQQVQPHFLFNSLNAIAALMREGEAAKAVEALALLSTLLRQLMNYAGQPEIALMREFDYAQCYLSVEKVRFEERLVTRFEAEDDCLNAIVPTLILQPLVENAVKHGIAQRRTPGRVTISARRIGDRLQLQVINDPAEGGRRACDSHGIGLSATRTRLERLFGRQQKLECVPNGPDGTIVTLEFPFRTAPVTDPTPP